MEAQCAFPYHVKQPYTRNTWLTSPGSGCGTWPPPSGRRTSGTRLRSASWTEVWTASDLLPQGLIKVIDENLAKPLVCHSVEPAAW
jgi:hypothetical protein